MEVQDVIKTTIKNKYLKIFISSPYIAAVT